MLRQPALVVNSGRMGEFDVTVRGAGEYFVTSVPATLKDRVQDPAVLDQLSRSATIVHVGEGERATVTVNVAVEQ
jgi:hypothetical protein